jgi:GT2 family glycosyltransferase
MSPRSRDFEVSVVVPTRDRADLVGETIDGLLAQTHPAAEIIVVDDGSTDDTASVVKGFDAPVRYHRVERVGPSAARNAGVSLSRSPWIAFCDSDDVWLPTKLERQLRLHALCPALEYSITDFVRVASEEGLGRSGFADAPAGFWSADRRELESRLWVYEVPLYDRFLRFQPMFPSTLLLSKRRWEALGGFNELPLMGVCEDFEFGLRQSGVPPIGIVAEALVRIRVHPGNRSRDLVAALLTQAAILDYALAEHPAARTHAAIVGEEIQIKRTLAAGRAFALGQLDILRELFPLIEPARRDWKLSLKMTVAGLPAPLARAMQRFLVRANTWRSGAAHSTRGATPPVS